MKIDNISVDQNSRLCFLELLKTNKEDFNVNPENLDKLNVKYAISQIFEPDDKISETQYIPKKNIEFKNHHLSITFSLEELPYPERCQITFNKVVFTFKQGEKRVVPIHATYPFLEIQFIEQENSSEEVESVVHQLHNESLVNKFKGKKEALNAQIEIAPVSENFGIFEIMEDTLEVFREFEKKSNNIQDVETEDMEYSLREKILECLFLSISYITSLKIIDDTEVKELTAKLIQKYYGEYLN